MSRLMTSLRAAARGTRLLAAEEEPSGDENMEADTPPAEEAEGAPEKDTPAEAAEDKAEDAPAGDEPDGDETPPEEEPAGDETDEASVRAATMAERRRCIAIMTHPKAEANPDLAAKMVVDGMTAKQAASLLDAAGGTAATGSSLAERMAAFQGDRKAGADAPAATRNPALSAAGNRFVNLAKARHEAGRRKGQ